jgi:hypothetical protein
LTIVGQRKKSATKSDVNHARQDSPAVKGPVIGERRRRAKEQTTNVEQKAKGMHRNGGKEWWWGTVKTS